MCVSGVCAAQAVLSAALYPKPENRPSIETIVRTLNDCVPELLAIQEQQQAQLQTGPELMLAEPPPCAYQHPLHQRQVEYQKQLQQKREEDERQMDWLMQLGQKRQEDDRAKQEEMERARQQQERWLQPSWQQWPPAMQATDGLGAYQLQPQPSWQAQPQIGWQAQPQPSWQAQPQIGWQAQPQPSWQAQPQIGWQAQPQPSWQAQPQPSWQAQPHMQAQPQPQPSWQAEAHAQPSWQAQPQANWQAQPQMASQSPHARYESSQIQSPGARVQAPAQPACSDDVSMEMLLPDDLF